MSPFNNNVALSIIAWIASGTVSKSVLVIRFHLMPDLFQPAAKCLISSSLLQRVTEETSI